MRSRSSTTQLELGAAQAFVEAVESLGLSASVSESRSSEVLLDLPGDKRLKLEIKAASVLTVDRIRAIANSVGSGTSVVVVADRISFAIRSDLNGAGVGWFDRRGHLRLVADGVFIDTDVQPDLRPETTRPSSGPVIRGRAGVAAVSALLLRPDDPMGVSEIARRVDLNPSSISRALAAIADAQLAQQIGRGRYRPLVPELFWALAEVWPRRGSSVVLALEELDDPRLGLNVATLEGPGLAQGGARGAVSWGAPLMLTGDYPAVLYVPDEQSLRVTQALLYRSASLPRSGSGPGSHSVSPRVHPTRDHVRGAATVDLRVDPTGLVTRLRYRHSGGTLPLAHPLFCALDLSDASRDREALDQWAPPEEFSRVW